MNKGSYASFSQGTIASNGGHGVYVGFASAGIGGGSVISNNRQCGVYGDFVVLSVADRGPGFPPTIARSGSLGMQLIRALARQLGATLELGSEGGGRVTLRMTRVGVAPTAA